jgi:uncharacterized protein YndB with AHSA1/START domain
MPVASFFSILRIKTKKMKTAIHADVSTEINAPAQKVWDALTKPEQVKQWFFGTEMKTDWVPGNPITFSGEWQGKTYEDKGTVMVVEPVKMIRYTYWSSMSGIEDKPENYVQITYRLHEENGKTRLTIKQENIPDEDMKGHSEENWNMVLEDLKEFCEK